MLYTVESSLNTDTPIMLINTHIGQPPGEEMGVDGAVFQSELLHLDNMGFKAIKVYINSPGGVVSDGYNIVSAILKSTTPVDTYNVGMCASIAGAIFMAGRKRVMADYANLMMHPPGNSDDKKALGATKDSIVTMLSSKAGIPSAEVDYLMDRTTWLNAAECFAKGFCTDIEVSSDHNRKRMPVLNADDTKTWKKSWKTANLILNSIFQTENILDMSKITNRLKLVDGANDEAVLASIDAIENRATTAETNLATEKEETGKLTNKVTELETTIQGYKDKETEAADKLKADNEAAELTAVTNVADAAILAGKFKAEEKPGLITNGVKLGSVEFKKMVEAIPLNKKANTTITNLVIGDGETGKLTGLTNYAAQKMAELQAKQNS